MKKVLAWLLVVTLTNRDLALLQRFINEWEATE